MYCVPCLADDRYNDAVTTIKGSAYCIDCAKIVIREMSTNTLEWEVIKRNRAKPAKWEGPEGHKANCDYIQKTGFGFGSCSCGWSLYCYRTIEGARITERLERSVSGLSNERV